MSISTALFGFLLLNTSALLFLSIYIVITLSDLDCDYLNPTQCSSKLSKWLIPEVIAFVINFVLIIITNRWILFLINLPMLVNIIYLYYISIPRGSIGFYDPSEIHLQGNLKKHIKVASLRLFFHLVHFFIYLYLFIISLLTST